LKKGVLTPKEIEAIALAVGANNTCDYCVAAHTVIGKMSGLTEAETIEARQGISSDEKMDALLELAVEISQKRGRPMRKVVDAFKAAGYSDAALIEVTAWVAYNLFTNYFNHIAETEVDFPKPPEIV
jgi:AhpD family alkylhydroperoxidase